MQPTLQENATEQSKYEAWFTDFIADLKVTQLQLETDTAHEKVKFVFDGLIAGNLKNLLISNDRYKQEVFVKEIVAEYIKNLNNKYPVKLAFDFNENEVLVWAVVKDDDEEMENNLLINEAKINAMFYPHFTMNSMIVEESDGISTPNHYAIFN